MSRGRIMAVIGVIAVIGGWYAFRPERLFVDKTVNESFEVAGGSSGETASAAMLNGMFHGVAHETRGMAAVHVTPDGKRTLRLTNFETSNGPDVRVYLIAATDASDSETVTKAGFIELGALKGNIGDQNYEIPADVDLATYRAVTIWCKRFGVNFGTAPLMDGAMAGEMPAATGAMPVTLGMGRFHTVAHETKGVATIYEQPNGERVLRLTEFETSNGPDVRVYLIASTDAMDNETVTRAGFIELGKLKGNVGDQNYTVPADVELSKYQAVTIWCKRFGVNFGTAALVRS